MCKEWIASLVEWSVVSYYALTIAASRKDTDAFIQELNNIISGVPSGETYSILGNSKARVGSGRVMTMNGGE